MADSDAPVPALFAAMRQEGQVTVAKNFHDGTVRVEIGDKIEDITPDQARMLAEDCENQFRRDEEWGFLESKKLVKKLHAYAKAVEPYRDDSAVE